MISRKLIARAMILLFALTNLYSQVAISPTSAFLDDKQRFETIIIMNNSTDPQEVKLEFKFAYPKANEAGDIGLIYDDEEQEGLHSAAGWIRGFPKNFVLEAGARQTVRITAKPPRDIEPGMYWSRLITSSSAVSAEIGDVNQTGISAQINMQFNQITSIFYKNGELNTGLELTEVRTGVSGNNTNVFVHYTKSGNAPYLGSMHAQLIDDQGEIALERKMFVSIYSDGLRRIDLDTSALPSGNYELLVSMSSGRSDIPERDIVPAETKTIRGSYTKI